MSEKLTRPVVKKSVSILKDAIGSELTDLQDDRREAVQGVRR
jgi:hypothetical protein